MTITYWEVRHYDSLMGCFENEYDALDLVRQQGMSNAVTHHKKVLVLYQTLIEFENARESALREKALAKLTQEECRALGLK